MSRKQTFQAGNNVAYFGAGDFHIAEAVFRSIKGVKQTMCGYSGGEQEDPTFEDIESGNTNHVKVVKLVYEPTAINYGELLTVFFRCHNATEQTEANNPRHKSCIFTVDEQQVTYAKRAMQEAADRCN